MARPQAQKAAQEEPLERQRWKSADKLRKNIDAAEYKHVVLGLIFLKYISDSFEEVHAKLKAGEGAFAGADPEDKDEYSAENVFFVPAEARWSFLLSQATQATFGQFIDGAMDAIERENPLLTGVLPKVFSRQNLDPLSLGRLMKLIGSIALGEFALAEGKQGGQFYTPRSIVELLVAMLEPCKGRVKDISIYGQESDQTTWRLARMNLAIRGIDSSQVKWNTEGSFLDDAHKDLKAEFEAQLLEEARLNAAIAENLAKVKL